MFRYRLKRAAHFSLKKNFGKNQRKKYTYQSPSRGRCRLLKTEKKFSAHNEKGSMKRGEKRFPEKLRKFLTEHFFGPSHSRYVPIRAELLLPNSCC